ncbi:MAG: MBOAT family protein, partial [Clostridia bacterium]|nr:MBOAT family protein [Clostridia bacterium]
MAFTSASFLLFASIALLLYYTVPKRGQWIVLLGASYLFYWSAGAEYLLFILYTTAVTYLCALLMQRRADAEDAWVAQQRELLTKAERKTFRAREKKKRFWILLAGLALGFGILAVVKYTAFFLRGISSIGVALGGAPLSIPSLLLPLGISFYTFQSMGYLIDVYRKTVRAEKNPLRLALFVSFFPQLVQGPISRFDSLAPQLFGEHPFDGFRFRAGLGRVAWGYFKKMVVADTAMIAVKALVENKDGGFTGIYVFLLILLYSAQIYGDFTGGIDIT